MAAQSAGGPKAAAAAATIAASEETASARNPAHTQLPAPPSTAATAAAAADRIADSSLGGNRDPTQADDPVLQAHPATLYAPFHAYSLQQAIADGFVLNVLQRFVAVTPRIQILGLQLAREQRELLLKLDRANQAAGQPPADSKRIKSMKQELFSTRGLTWCSGATTGTAGASSSNSTSIGSVGNAAGQDDAAASLAEDLLMQAASNSRQLVAVKAEAIVQRFMSAWAEAAAAGFTAFRAMVVVRSRQHVVWYCQELRKLLQKQQYQQQLQGLLNQAGTLVDTTVAAAAAAGNAAPLCYGAFSGSVEMPAQEARTLHKKSQPLNTLQVCYNSNTAVCQSAKDAHTTAANGSGVIQGGRTLAGGTDGSTAGKKRRRNHSMSSGWDVALAGFDRNHPGKQSAEDQAAANQLQQQLGQQQVTQQAQQQQQQRSDTSSSGTTDSGSNDNHSNSSCSLHSNSDKGMGGNSASDSLSERAADADPSVDSTSGDNTSDAGQYNAPNRGRKDAVTPRHKQPKRSVTFSSNSFSQIIPADPASLSANAVAQSPSALPPNYQTCGSLHKVCSCPAVMSGSGVQAAASMAVAAVAAAAAGSTLDAIGDASNLGSLKGQNTTHLQALANHLETNSAGQQADQETVADASRLQITERDLNPTGFQPGDARILVACSKFETGYDDPRLGALFIDRSLSGPRAVQVLGRINRPAPGKGLPLTTATAHSTPSAAANSSACSSDRSVGNGRMKPEFNVLVVDFVNSVGAIREAFSEFYDVTTFCTGNSAKRARQHRMLDGALSCVLEILQPAAARAAAMGSLQQRLAQHQQQNQPGTSTNTQAQQQPQPSANLAELDVKQAVKLVFQLPPDTQTAVEDGLQNYCSMCNKLRVEKLEFPYVFAAALLAEIVAKRQRRGRAVMEGRFGWLEKLIATGLAPASQPAAATAAATAEAQRHAARQDDGAHSVAASGTAQVSSKADTTAVGQNAQLQKQQSQQVPTDTSKLEQSSNSMSSLRRQLQVAVNVCQLEETFAGSVMLQPSDRPLGSVRLASHISAVAAGAAVCKHKSSMEGLCTSPEADVKAGRSLGEVIAAANARLSGKFKRQVTAGLQELCRRLDNVRGTASNASPLGRQTPYESSRLRADTVAAVAGQQQQSQDTRQTGEALGEQQQQQHGTEVDNLDVYTVLSLLRRLQLWPITAQLLRATGAGKQVSALQNHPHPLVHNLAAEVVRHWKATVSQQTAAAAANKSSRKNAQQGQQHGKTGAAVAGQAADAIEQGLRGKIRKLFRDALLERQRRVLQWQQQQPPLSLELSALDEQQSLQQLAESLELELHKFVIQPLNSSSNGSSSTASRSESPAAAATAGVGPNGWLAAGSRSTADAALQEYKRRARMLVTGLKYPDGIAGSLIAKEKSAAQVVGLDALSLAPAAVQKEVKQRREAQKKSEQVWEALAEQSVGGGGTFVTTEVTCPQCGEKRAQVHNIMSGGTYAQERVPIQKYVCQGCMYAWRNDG
eukprot:GHRR01006055.1.p1 GENE.GHRR01006055.1~~GHRR01006055.1.p1  ORF type:complete len:1758 (+),score=833.29 GHRR01006055.1:791-5275(+)